MEHRKSLTWVTWLKMWADLIPLPSYPRNYQVGAAVSKVKFMGWIHMDQIIFDMFACDACVCLFKEQE